MGTPRPHNFYLDSNRLSRETDRRLHAADAENADVTVQVPPRVAGELAQGVMVGAWHESREIADKTKLRPKGWEIPPGYWMRGRTNGGRISGPNTMDCTGYGHWTRSRKKRPAACWKKTVWTARRSRDGRKDRSMNTTMWRVQFVEGYSHHDGSNREPSGTWQASRVIRYDSPSKLDVPGIVRE